MLKALLIILAAFFILSGGSYISYLATAAREERNAKQAENEALAKERKVLAETLKTEKEDKKNTKRETPAKEAENLLEEQKQR